ncbi:MAG: MerR family transcriptional regulator [Verrucomicrobiaceae bacterium]|nr:MerR family transcriptional regulator [Verrucomicrobiaceae bacterium]
MSNLTPSELIESAEFVITGRARYSLEVLAEMSGTNTEAVLFYQDQGFIKPCATEAADGACFDANAVRILRRLEMLKESCEMNLDGLKLLHSLMEEIERLQAELHRARTP